MKKNLLSAFIAAIMLMSSCSKEAAFEPKGEDQTLYPVTFNVSTFKSEIVPMAAATYKLNKFAFQGNGLAGQNFQASGMGYDWLGHKLESIQYYVINESGAQVNHISQWNLEEFDKGDAEFDTRPNVNFGKIEDTLPVGKYKIIFISNWNSLNGSPDYRYANINPNYDMYAQELEITVTDKPLEQAIVLERVVGKLEIKILDNIPEDIGRIEYSISDISTNHYFQGRKAGVNGKFEHVVYTHDPTFKERLFFFFGYQLGEDSSGSAVVNIRAYGKSGNIVVDKIIRDVPVAVNKTTILSGELFDDSGTSKGQGFSVSLQDQWLNGENISF